MKTNHPNKETINVLLDSLRIIESVQLLYSCMRFRRTLEQGYKYQQIVDDLAKLTDELKIIYDLDFTHLTWLSKTIRFELSDNLFLYDKVKYVDNEGVTNE